MTKLTAAQKRNATRQANKAAEEEQRKVQHREFTIKQMRESRYVEPVYKFKLGDRVSIGNIATTVGLEVVQIFDDGQFYECAYDYIGESYGKPVREVGTKLWHWHELQPFRTPEERTKRPTFSKFSESRLNFSQRTIDALILSYYRWNIDMSPEYQRGNVWTQKEKELLIESIFENRDIGKFVIILRPFAPWPAPHAEILDGKQRLTTLIEFYENRFPYKGVYFNDLHWRDQGHFERYAVAWAELGENTTTKEKLEYFLKLNIAGIPQDPEHIKYIEQLLEQENAKS